MSSHQSSPNSMAAEEEEEEEGAADWSNLPYDLIEEIMDQIAKYTLDISDYAHCAAVCVSWRQVYKVHDPSISPQLPVLMIPTNTPSSSSNENQFYSFYRITDGKVYDRLKLSMPSYRQCRGSSYGWLVTVDDVVDKGFPVKLVNPFLKYSIPLPSLKHLPVYDSDDEDYGYNGPSDYTYLHKAILSADPLSPAGHCIVMAIYGGERFKRLAYWRAGDQAWASIGPNKGVKFEDVIILKKNGGSDSYSYLNDEFRAITSGGHFFSFKVRDILDENAADIFANIHKRSEYVCSRLKLPHVPNKKIYLVPVLNNTWFFLVLRVIDMGVEDETTEKSPYSTKEFKVFLRYSMKEQDGGNISYSTTKEQEGGSFVYREMKTLIRHTFFIGANASMSIAAKDCPPGCKRDCIYYTDDCYLDYVKDAAGNGAYDMGLFNVKDVSFEKHYPTNANNPIWPNNPIWVEPSIQKAGCVFRKQVVFARSLSSTSKCL